MQTFRLDEGERAGDPVRDLKALANLRHTNVARIKEVTEKDGEVTIVSPFNDGETLAALRKVGPLPLPVELRILVDVLAGLAAIHGAKDSKLKPLGIVHGELAPANIVIGTDGVPKVIQLAGVHANPGVQGADTLGYVAPEILLADDSFDQRVDVYSVGVMLWEALTGTTLFPETNAGAIVTRHLSGRIRKPTVPADAPWAEALVEVAQKAIATDPGARYANANDFAAEIKRVAKTNVAPTMKVAAAVKERGADAINARRTALGLPPLAVPKTPAIAIKTPAPKPTPEPPKAAPAALGPAPTPANGAPTTKPVATEEVLAADENLRDTAVKPIPAIRFVPPEPVDPAVHDRITSPSPIPVVRDEAGADQPADFSDLAFDSEPPPPPAAPPKPPPKKAEKVEDVVAAAPVVEKPAELTPPPPAAFTPSPFAAPTPRPEQPSDTPAANPIASPFDGPTSAPADDAQKKKRVIMFAAIGAVALILIFGLRSCLSKPETETAAKQPAPTATAATTTMAKTAEPTATAADPAVTATNTANTAKTAPPEPDPTATAEPTVAAKSDPPPSTPPTNNPPTTNTGGGGKTPPAGTPPVKTKPKSYDPLGI